MQALMKRHREFLVAAQALADLPDIAEAQRQYAAALDKEATALTEAEKKQATMNAVLEQISD